MEKDRPGDIDPEEEKEQGAESAVDAGVGLVVENIEEEAAFCQIPYEGSDEGAGQSGTGGDVAPWGELIGEVEEQPDDQIGEEVVDMQGSRDSHRFQGRLDLAGEPEGTPQHQRQKEQQKEIGAKGPPRTPLGCFENVIDDEVIIFEEKHRGDKDIADADVAQFVGVGHELIDIGHDGGGVGGDQVFGDEFVKLPVGGIEDRHMGEEHQQDHHERDDEKEGAPAHAGGIEAEPVVEEIFEKIPDEKPVLFEEGFFLF